MPSDPFRRVIKNKFLFFVLLAVILLIGYRYFIIYQQMQVVAREIKAKEQQVAALEDSNEELVALIEYLNSSAYLEKKARLDLNLKKPGEQAVIVPNVAAKTITQTEDGEEVFGQSNIQDWWNYFFN